MTTTKSMKTPGMKVPEGYQTTGEALGVGALLIDSPSMEIPEGGQTTGEALVILLIE